MSFLKWLLGGYKNYGGGHHGRDFRRNKHGYMGGDYNDQPQGFNRAQNDAAICKQCNTANTTNARFCQQCGGSMLPTRCAQCNAVVEASSKFCPQCGKAV